MISSRDASAEFLFLKPTYPMATEVPGNRDWGKLGARLGYCPN